MSSRMKPDHAPMVPVKAEEKEQLYAMDVGDDEWMEEEIVEEDGAFGTAGEVKMELVM